MAVNAMFLVRSDDDAAAAPAAVCRRLCPMLHVLSARLLILCFTSLCSPAASLRRSSAACCALSGRTRSTTKWPHWPDRRCRRVSSHAHPDEEEAAQCNEPRADACSRQCARQCCTLLSSLTDAVTHDGRMAVVGVLAQASSWSVRSFCSCRSSAHSARGRRFALDLDWCEATDRNRGRETMQRGAMRCSDSSRRE